MGGGAERQVSLIAQLSEVELIILLQPGIMYDVDMSKVVMVQNFKATNVASKAMQILRALLLFRKIKLNKHDNLICLLQLSTIVGVIAKILFGVQYTLCHRTSPLGYYANNKGLKLPFSVFKVMMNLANCNLCNSLSSAQQIQSLLPKANVTTIANGYNFAAIQTKSVEIAETWKRFCKDHKVLIHVGRLAHEKAQDKLIEILAKLKAKGCLYKLVLVGSGTTKDALYLQCVNSGLVAVDFDPFQQDQKIPQADVFFVSFCSNPYALMKHAYLMLLPSLFEGLPNTLIEALVCSTPVLACDCDTGPREILLPQSNLKDKTLVPVDCLAGYLMPQWQVAQTAEQQNQLIQNWVLILQKLYADTKKVDVLAQNTVATVEAYSDDYILSQWRKWLNKQ